MRSIPARAGEPPRSRSRRRGGRVYPRACGGTAGCSSGSPGQEGSIPARAGEPGAGAAGPRSRQVYPRACGGTGDDRGSRFWSSGLSPRVRGNLRRSARASRILWSIPARAGGTLSGSSHASSCTGLSPRVLGEPPGDWHGASRGPVYPRACGGTIQVCNESADATGLSPRVRGNRESRFSYCSTSGSIPARAGEPRCTRWGGRTTRVYPRACGGTLCCDKLLSSRYGLSPRVRGNRHVEGHEPLAERSIPARAGEPGADLTQIDAKRVYPRACGGTISGRWAHMRARGLSPRVRGNPAGEGRHVDGDRSIPARAGEPGGRRRAACRRGVYPRACGGTHCRHGHHLVGRGLSPRVRGTRMRHEQ